MLIGSDFRPAGASQIVGSPSTGYPCNPSAPAVTPRLVFEQETSTGDKRKSRLDVGGGAHRRRVVARHVHRGNRQPGHPLGPGGQRCEGRGELPAAVVVRCVQLDQHAARALQHLSQPPRRLGPSVAGGGSMFAAWTVRQQHLLVERRADHDSDVGLCLQRDQRDNMQVPPVTPRQLLHAAAARSLLRAVPFSFSLSLPPVRPFCSSS